MCAFLCEVIGRSDDRNVLLLSLKLRGSNCYSLQVQSKDKKHLSVSLKLPDVDCKLLYASIYRERIMSDRNKAAAIAIAKATGCSNRKPEFMPLHN